MFQNYTIMTTHKGNLKQINVRAYFSAILNTAWMLLSFCLITT